MGRYWEEEGMEVETVNRKEYPVEMTGTHYPTRNICGKLLKRLSFKKRFL
jgi:hypothetical protein